MIKINSFKNLLIVMVFLGATFQSNAQAELKINPVFALFNVFQIGVEIPIGQDFGIEPEILFVAADGDVGGGLLVHGKYYFNPIMGGDRVYCGAFLGGVGGDGEGGAAFGFEGGYKFVGSRNILLDLAGGVSRVAGFDELDVLPYLKISIGYRFKKKE